jgi:hypothetical protein
MKQQNDYWPTLTYDLETRPEDVCFQIVSAEVMQYGAATNVVVIPKKAIAEAINGTP